MEQFDIYNKLHITSGIGKQQNGASYFLPNTAITIFNPRATKCEQLLPLHNEWVEQAQTPVLVTAEEFKPLKYSKLTE